MPIEHSLNSKSKNAIRAGFALSLLAVVIAGWYVSGHQERAHEAALRDRVAGLAKVVAAMGSAENLKRLVFPRAGAAPDMALLDYHKRLTKLASAICDADADILRVRFFAKPPKGEILVVLDAASGRHANDGSKLGAPYPDAPLGLQQAFAESKVKTLVSMDKGEAKVSGFAPLMGAAAPTGIVVGLEVDATAWRHGVQVARWIAKGVTLFFALLLVALFWIVQRPARAAVEEQLIAGARVETPEPMSAPERLEAAAPAAVDTEKFALLIISAKGEIVECNPEFVALWNVPLDLLTQKEYAPVLKWITSQIGDPEAFLKQIESAGSAMGAEDFSKVKLKDGRVLEYLSMLEKSEAGTSWILKFRKD